MAEDAADGDASTDDVADAGSATGGGADVDQEGARQEVVAVDADDEPRGTVDRLEAHTGEGIRHRAFTALVSDPDGNLLLAQRAAGKRLWATYWDGTVASHPGAGQSQVEATRKRLAEELGVEPDQYRGLRVTDRFEYKRYFENEGVEWEVCAVLKATLTDATLAPNPAEVGGLLWVPCDRLRDHPEFYRQLRLCPWFEIALRRDES